MYSSRSLLFRHPSFPRTLVAAIFRLDAESWLAGSNLSLMWTACPELPVTRMHIAGANAPFDA
jgi:hypothetical protein